MKTKLCRLLGYVCEQPTSPASALGDSAFAAFTSLSALHGDGWGMAWRDRHSGATCAKTSPLPAAEDPTYSKFARRALGTTGLVHLRWATDGLVVDPANTHPFVAGAYALAHNGSIAPIERLEQLLTTESLNALHGDTDSERYFRFVLQCINERDGDERAGLLHAVGMIQEQFPASSLNALFLTPTHLYAVHVNSRAQAPLDDMRELFGSEDAMPHGHVSAYFDMAYRISPTAVHVISSGLPDEGWTPVPSDSVLAIEQHTREVVVLAIAPSTPAQ